MIGLIAAKGFVAALNESFASVFLIIAGVAVMAPAIAATVFVPLSARWTALQRSAVAAGIAGVVLSVLGGFFAWLAALVAANMLGGLQPLAPAMPYVSAATVGAALWFQLRHRATFSLVRAAAITGAILAPAVFLGLSG